MDSKRIVKVKNLNRPITKPEPVSQPQEQPQIEPPEQPEPVVHMESLAEFPKDESVYGSGWSLAQLMNEFSARASDCRLNRC